MLCTAGVFISFLHLELQSCLSAHRSGDRLGLDLPKDICQTYFKIMLLAIKYLDNPLGTFP